ncbi:hypothetical protein SUGI_0127130 [Cryptomeria japonica]|uniref:ethylene-responsive transcription factor ERF016-like n=1 Tax=Cryptomeria japonica TaxID=3369 RepID=UPI0024089D06|nr:ethylene-responsive transcription factor ERF016-like [Cryptomeria japonica]GLJ10378.1 hypothetical protein SUGI_0127130 [Cryptomeria japonica]
MSTPVNQEHARIPPPVNLGEKSRKFKGIRMRKWGKWVSEVRMPNSRAKIWLGSYDTAEQAARAFDAAIYCLRGPHAKFNFPDTIPAIPSASSLSRQQIQAAAAKYARGQIPSTCENNCSALPEMPFSPPISSTPSEMQILSDSLLMSEHLDFELGESLFVHSDSNQLLNLDELLFDDAATSELTSPTGEPGSKFFDSSQFWNF